MCARRSLEQRLFRWWIMLLPLVSAVTRWILFQLLDLSEEIFGPDIRKFLHSSFSSTGFAAAVAISLWGLAWTIICLRQREHLMEAVAPVSLAIAVGAGLAIYLAAPHFRSVPTTWLAITIPLSISIALWAIARFGRLSFKGRLIWPVAASIGGAILTIFCLLPALIPLRPLAKVPIEDPKPPSPTITSTRETIIPAPTRTPRPIVTPAPFSTVGPPTRIPTATPSPALPASPTLSPRESTCPPMPLLPPPLGATHEVRPGESLYAIAALYDTSVEILIALNSEHYSLLEPSPDCLRIGWWLIVPSK